MANEYDALIGNEYDSIASEEDNARKTALYGSVKASESVNPDQHAEVLKLSERTKIPPAVVSRNIDSAKAVERRSEYDDILTNSPQVAQWLSESPDNTALASDDLKSLSALETTFTKIGDYTRGIGEGVVGKSLGSLFSGAGELYGVAQRGFDSALSKVLPDETMKSLQDPIFPWWTQPEQLLKWEGEGLKQVGREIGVPESRKGIDTDIAEGVGQLGGTIFTALAAGPVVVTTSLYAQGADVMAEKTKDDNATQGQKDIATVTGAGITAITEKYGLGKILDRVPPQIKSKVLQKMADIAIAGGIEAAQEFTEGLLQDLTRRALTNEDAPILEGIDREMLAAGGAGAIVRTILTSAMGVKARNGAKEQEQFFKEIGENAANSKLKERLPEKYQEVIEKLTQGKVENVYAPVEFFQSHYEEQGLNPRDVAEQMGISEAYNESTQTGAKIPIPTGVYARYIAGSESEGAFVKEMTTAADALNSREAKEVDTVVEKAKEEPDTFMGENTSPEAAFEASLETIKQDVLEQQKDIFEPSVSEQHARLTVERYRARATRVGVDPLELYEQRKKTIGRDLGVIGGMELNQSDKVTETPEFKNWFGESKVVDESGKPLVVYHGTDVDFSEFDKSKINRNFQYSFGFHFTTRTKEADIYAGPNTRATDPVVMPVHIKVENPLVIETDHPAASMEADLNRSDIIEKLVHAKRAGKPYDGVIIKRRRGDEWDGDNIIVFEPTQIKSAIGNRGTFDPNDPNILKQGKETTRGLIRIGENGSIDMRLLKDANLSTFLHETGHIWFFEMMDDASLLAAKDDLTPAQQKIVNDFDALMEWMGLEVRAKDGDKAILSAMKEEHHEQFARGFESYLMEGKAPSHALRSMFARFRSWLVSIYRDIKKLNVQLKPEVRAIMDRLVATDDQIDAAKSEGMISPVFTTAEEAGMTDIQFSAYQDTIEKANRKATEELEQKLIQQYLRERKDWWKEELGKVREDVAKQVDEQKVYKAIAALKSDQLKLDKKSLQSTLYADIAKRLPKGITAKEGVSPDQAAEILGYPSGESLIRDLSTARNRKQLIESESDRLMREKHGDMMMDGTIYEEVKKAVHNDLSGKIAEMELTALRKKAREVKPFIKAKENEDRQKDAAGRDTYQAIVMSVAKSREIAAKMIAAKPIKNLRPHEYFVAARKASRAAVEAVRKEKYIIAANNKSHEMVSTEMYREAIRVEEEINTSIDKFKAMFKPDDKLAKNRNMDLVNAARAILAQYGIGRSESGALEYLEKIKRYAPDVYEEINQLVIESSVNAKNYKDLTTEQFIGMRDAVNSLWFLSRRSKQVEIDGNKMELEEITESLVGRLNEINVPKDIPGMHRDVTDEDKRWFGVLNTKAALRKVESWVDSMDGGDKGPFRSYIWNPIREASTRYRESKADHLKKYLELVKKIEGTLTTEKIDAPEIGWVFKGRMSLVHAILHSGNESNKSKLIRGNKWGDLREDGTLDTSRWDAFVSRMHREGVITKADYDFAQSVWDLLDEMKPSAQKAFHGIYGYYFKEITANPVVTPWGTYKGGYVPAYPDPDASNDAAVRREIEDIENGGAKFVLPSTGRGFTHSRVDAYAAPLALDLRLLPQHIDKVLRFTHIQPAVLDVTKIVKSRAFSSRLSAMDIKAIPNMLLPWLDRSAKQVVETPMRGYPGVSKFWRTLRQRTGIGVMFANVVNTLQQVTGLSMASLKTSGIRRSLYQYMKSPKETADFVSSKSAFMRNDRMSSQVIDIMNSIDDILLNPSKYEKVQDFAKRHAYFMQAAAQNVIDVVVWKAAYEDGYSKGMDETEAIRHADSVIRLTQGSHSPEDISRIEANNAFVRMFLMFFNYFNMQANFLGTEFTKVTRELGFSKKAAPRLFYIYLMGFAIPALIADAIVQVSDGDIDDDDDGYIDDFLKWFFGAQFRTAAAFLPGGGSVASTFNALNDKVYDDRVTTSPAVSQLEASTIGTMKALKNLWEDGELTKKNIKDLLTAVGMATGLPVGTAGKPIGYILDVEEGRADPSGPIDYTRGLITGKSGS